MKITIEGENLKVSDGYHTIEELYEHRIVLFIALCRYSRDHYSVWMSILHSDGSSFEGWFILGIDERKGKQISYHLPLRFWEECKEFSKVLDKAPEWDGHTSADVLKRISEL
jgi:hypothetical protein